MFGVSVCARKRLKRSRRSRSWQKRKPRSKRRALERQSWLKGTARCRRNTMTDPVIHQLRRQTNKTASVGQTRSVRGGLIVLAVIAGFRSEEHTSELQSRRDLVCRLLLEKKNK